MDYQCRFAILNVLDSAPFSMDVASYGYCASKSETYYVFKGNLVISSEDMITDIADERESLGIFVVF